MWIAFAVLCFTVVCLGLACVKLWLRLDQVEWQATALENTVRSMLRQREEQSVGDQINNRINRTMWD